MQINQDFRLGENLSFLINRDFFTFIIVLLLRNLLISLAENFLLKQTFFYFPKNPIRSLTVFRVRINMLRIVIDTKFRVRFGDKHV